MTSRRQDTAATAIEAVLGSFDLALAAERKSRATRSSYLTAVRQFVAFTEAHARPTTIEAVRREDVAAFVVDLLARWKPTPAHNRYRGLHAFFG